MKIHKGDTVQMLRGKDRGKRGRVVEALPAEGRVIVENLNTVKRHTRPRPLKDSSRMGQQQVAPGGVIEKPSPVPVSAVMLVCPTCGRATRVGVKVNEIKGERVKVRQCKRADCREEIDQ
ncbi:MAG TPA: 50S ribosomal protein L24 [Gaiellaceae bacterium]